MFTKQVRKLYLVGLKNAIDFLRVNKEQPIEKLIEALEDIYKVMDGRD